MDTPSNQSSIHLLTAKDSISRSVLRTRQLIVQASEDVSTILSLPQTAATYTSLHKLLVSKHHTVEEPIVRRVKDMEELVFDGVLDLKVAAADFTLPLEMEMIVKSTYTTFLDDIRGNAEAAELIKSRPNTSIKTRDHITRLLGSLGDILAKRSLRRHSPSKTRDEGSVKEKVRAAEREISLLKDELARKQRQNERQRLELQGLVDNARKDYEYVYSGATSSKEKLEAHTAATSQNASDAHEAGVMELRLQLHQMKMDYAALHKTLDEAVRVAEKKADRGKLEASELISQYDTEMQAKYTTINELRVEAERDAKILHEFETYYSKVDAEMAKVAAEESAYHKLRVVDARNKAITAATTAATLVRWYRAKLAARKAKEAREKAAAKKAAKGKKK